MSGQPGYPPAGYGQQPGAGYGAPPGQPHPGQFPGQPGYGPAQPVGPGSRPPAKGRTGLVVGIVAGVVVLALAGVAGVVALDYFEEPGGDPGEQPIAECDLSADLKSQAHVSSFRLVEKPSEEQGSLRRANCAWGQTRGKDGRDPRNLQFLIYDYSDFSAKPEQNTEQAESSYDDLSAFANGLPTKPAEGLGDEALLVIEPTARDTVDVKLIARKGTTVWSITYSGRDKGIFSDSPMPQGEAEAVVRKAAEELLAKS
ncbi:hypothetical protein [Saccharothrix syringae]|uniref:DUF3558 domain-containing protein n=1 Tax=Saccharothrix syringae TaxID=103733 RepID=A0A5Q0HBT7_SACSY|nr:hypothetical protein [Saccharothrix syringae]QFZ23383.1 hypothetical protein EKG83_43405 [Saccharothrix syringae]